MCGKLSCTSASSPANSIDVVLLPEGSVTLQCVAESCQEGRQQAAHSFIVEKMAAKRHVVVLIQTS